MDSKTDIENFIASNRLDIDLLDGPSEAPEAWRLKWEGLAKGLMIRPRFHFD